MDRLPKIGERVKYPGRPGHIGPCTGTVMEIYPAYDPPPGFDDEDDPPFNSYAQASFDPERWRVSLKVDTIPTPWPYQGDRVAPAIADLESE